MIYAGVSKLRSTAQQIADGSPIINGSTTIGYVAPIEAVLGKAGANGLYFDGVNDDGAMTDAANQAIGTSDFYIFVTVGASDWTPAATECLYSKISGNNGVKLNLTTAGLLQLQIGNGTNFTTFSYNSTVAVPTADYHTAWVGVTVDRDGVATFLWNGSRLGDTVDVSGSVAQSATAAATAYLMRDGSNYQAGRVYTFHMGNYCPDAATCLRYYMYGVPNSDKWGSFAAAYTSDFSAGADSFTGVQGTATGNIDGVTDGSVSKDDTLRFYANTNNSVHRAIRAATALAGKRYRVAGSCYIPNSGGTTYLDGCALTHGTSSPSASNTFATITTVGAWTSFSGEILGNESYDGYLSAYPRKGGTYTFVGANAATDDLFYLHGLVVTQIGCVVCLDGSVPGSVWSGVWLGQSSNGINAAVTGATTLQNQFLGGGNVATNTALGDAALSANTTGVGNTAFGASALKVNSIGLNMSAFGLGALSANTTGTTNSAFGANALLSNTIGSFNCAFGTNALKANTTGTGNTAFGTSSLSANTIGTNNSAFGAYALWSNTTGINNTAAGYTSLYANTTGVSNTAFGVNALRANTIGTSNSAFGLGALSANTTGTSNTAFGSNAGLAITTGSSNTFIGLSADGAAAGDSQIAIGRGATTTASNQIAIGSASYKVGFDGANPYATAGAPAGFWRPILNGTAYKIAILADA